MRNQVVSLNAVANSTPFYVDNYTGVVNVGIAVVVSGTATYSVQYTYDDLSNSAITPTWFTLTALSAQTATKDSNINFPCKGIRLSVTAYTSGTITMTVVQARQGPGSH